MGQRKLVEPEADRTDELLETLIILEGVKAGANKNGLAKLLHVHNSRVSAISKLMPDMQKAAKHGS